MKLMESNDMNLRVGEIIRIHHSERLRPRKWPRGNAEMFRFAQHDLIRKIFIFLLSTLLLLLATFTASAQSGRDMAIEQEILDRLEAINPEAVPVFQEATEALDAGNFEAARAGYERVLELAPDFPDALRRLSRAEMSLDLMDEAVAHARSAFDIDPSAVNKLNLAEFLSFSEAPADTLKALNLAKEGVQEMPGDSYAYSVLMFAAFGEQDIETLRTACQELFRLEPDYAVAHFYYSFVMAEDGRWEKAESEMLVAQDLGMDAEFIQQVLNETGIARQALIYRSARWAGYVVAGWLVGLLLLFVAGLGLSKVTLKAVEKARSTGTTTPSSSELFVRSLYRRVIGLTSAYFYLSIPILIVIVVAVGIGLIYLMLVQEYVVLKLVVFVGIAVLATLFAIVRSLFIRFKQEEPGRPLTEPEAPALWKLTQDIATRLKTRPIQAIYLTPGTEIAVFEQGGSLKKSRGLGKRSLLLGIGVLAGMTQGQLKSILAHEYGHFTGKDTAGGNLALRVLNSIQMMTIGLITSGQARWYNPAWWFVRGFYNLFLRITLGASRLQEILADRYAAVNYGARNFIEGLRHIIRQSITFEMLVNGEIKQAIENNVPIHNLYTLAGPISGEDTHTLEEAYQKALDRETGAFDSHPSPAMRIQLVEQLHQPWGFGDLDDGRPAWELLPDGGSLQDEMTALVQGRIDQRRQEVGVSTA